MATLESALKSPYYNDPRYGLAEYLKQFGMGNIADYSFIEGDGGMQIRDAEGGRVRNFDEGIAEYDPASRYGQDQWNSGTLALTDGIQGWQGAAQHFGYPDAKAYIEAIQGPGTWGRDSYGNITYTPSSGALKPFPEYDPGGWKEDLAGIFRVAAPFLPVVGQISGFSDILANAIGGGTGSATGAAAGGVGEAALTASGITAADMGQIALIAAEQGMSSAEIAGLLTSHYGIPAATAASVLGQVGLTEALPATQTPTTVPPGPGSKLLDKATDSVIGTGISAGINALTTDDGSGEIDSSIALAQQEEERKNDLRRRIGEIFGADFSGEEDAIAKANRDYYGADLKKRYDENERQLRFGVARSGNTLGSVDIQGRQKLNEENARGGMEIEDAVRRSINNLRSNREGAKMNALNLVSSGAGEEAVGSAASQLRAATDSASSASREQLFGGLFADAALMNAQAGGARNRATLADYAAAMRRARPGVTNPVDSPTIYQR